MQRSFEFTKNNGEKAKEDVTVNVNENYVQYHVKENEADELWVVKDYNRVRTSLIMVALCNRADHYIFALWFLLSFILSFFLLFFLSLFLFFPRLISAVADWMSIILLYTMWP